MDGPLEGLELWRPDHAQRRPEWLRHDLPAMRGTDVLDEVLDGPQSIAFRQAYHKMTSAMAVLHWCIGEQSLHSSEL